MSKACYIMMDQPDLNIGIFWLVFEAKFSKQSIDFASGQIKVIIRVGLVLV